MISSFPGRLVILQGQGTHGVEEWFFLHERPNERAAKDEHKQTNRDGIIDTHSANRSTDDVPDDELSNSLRATLLTYEPRLDGKTIRVRREGSIGPEQLKLRFIVHADLKAESLNVPVEFVADVELDSGDIQINRL